MEIGSCWDVWLGHQIPIVECGKTIFLWLAWTPQKLNREYQLYLWEICKGDGALLSLPATPIKFVFTLCFTISWATNLLFGWPTHAHMILLPTWTTLCCIFELPPVDIKLFWSFRTAQGLCNACLMPSFAKALLEGNGEIQTDSHLLSARL